MKLWTITAVTIVVFGVLVIGTDSVYGERSFQGTVVPEAQNEFLPPASQIIPDSLEKCADFEKSQRAYFDMCAKEGYENVCLDKTSGEYYGCTRGSYNDCTEHNVNKDKNILCKARLSAASPPDEKSEEEPSKNLFWSVIESFLEPFYASDKKDAKTDEKTFDSPPVKEERVDKPAKEFTIPPGVVQPLYQYLNNPKSISSRIMTQSCRTVLTHMEKENLNEWRESVPDGAGNLMEIWMPTGYVTTICQFSPLITTSLLNDARSKAEAALKGEIEVGEEKKEPAGMRKRPFDYLKGFIDFFRAPEAEGKVGDDLKPCTCKITSLKGQMEIRESPNGEWREAKVGDVISSDTDVSTGFDTEVKLLCKDEQGNVFERSMGSLTQFQILKSFICSGWSEEYMRAAFKLEVGSMRGQVEKAEAKRVDFKVKTPVYVCSVKG